MKLLGILMVIAGWMIPVITLAVTQSNTARLVLTLLGIAITLVGILGVLNKAHLKHVIWKA
jgi:hypothetical protein